MNQQDRLLLHRLLELVQELSNTRKDLTRVTNGLDRQALQLVVDQLDQQIKLMGIRLSARISKEDLSRFLHS